MGDRRAHLEKALSRLPDIRGVSALYETEPVGGPSGQGPYLNAVVELDTELTARQLMEIGHDLELEAGRVRGERWGPRPLDVDVLLVGDSQVEEEDLVVPHPRMWERRFVLAPLSDLAPDLVPREVLDRTVGETTRVGTLDPRSDPGDTVPTA